MKNLRLYNISFIQGKLSDFRQRYLKHKSDLTWPSMIFEVILNQMKYLRIHNVSIHTILTKSVHK